MASEESCGAKAVGIKEEPTLNGNPSPAPQFVLIHGFGSGAWSWYKVKTLLENTCGYKVSCLDLTGAGNDRTDPATILTFQHYNKPLIDFLSALPPNQQVILVGHSAGGLSLSDAIHRFGSEKIKVAVFVAATMLKCGFVTDDDLRIGVPELNSSNQQSPPDISDGEYQRRMEYQLSPLEDYTLSKLLRRDGPFGAVTSAKFKVPENTDEVPRIYIKTMYDNVVKPWQQEAMIKKWPPSDVYEVASDHSPVFSAPVLLSGLLHKVAIIYG